MPTPIVQVDAFTNRPFAGNPAAVCVLPAARDAAWMQQVAQEMNLSETAFLQAHDDGYSLRWFTPTTEVDLCGHATLASAHVLWQNGYLAPDQQARFHTRSGLLTAARRGDTIELDFPAKPEQATPAPPGLIAALGVEPRYVGRNQFDYLVEVANAAAVRQIQPDFARLREVEVRGVIVTSSDDSGDYDFISRFFAPGSGIDEDPVTGSAHCCLAPFWSERLGKTTLRAFQASARGGELEVEVVGERVLLRGSAVTVLRGELLD